MRALERSGRLDRAGVLVEAKAVSRDELPEWLAERLSRQQQRASVETLEWLADRHKRAEFAKAAQAIETAIDGALQSPDTRTKDLGGKLGTEAFARHVAGQI